MYWPASMQTGVETRQVFDLPERLIEVTERRTRIHVCPHCRGATRAAFPEGAISPAQSGARIRAAAVYLNFQQLLPEDRAAQVLSDLFGAKLVCPANLAGRSAWKAEAPEGVYQAIGTQVASGRLRELKAPIEIDKEPWAPAMGDLILDAAKAVRQAREAGESALEPDHVQGFADRYWAAVREGLAFHRSLPAFDPSPPGKRKKQRPGHNLLIRFKTFKDQTLRFLVDFAVSFTNNLVERGLRMTKVKMKISGSFRTLEGARIFVRLWSIVSTARKQGLNILQALAATPSQLLAAIAP